MDYDEDEESNEYGSGMEEDDYDEDEEKNENAHEIITKIEGDELAGEEAGADGIASSSRRW